MLPIMKAGDRIAGKYHLQRLLGQGATASVWEAVHVLTGHRVAVKMITSPSDEFRKRLLREARVYGTLRHRNIVEIHDIGETPGGNPFLVMQLLLGETLADRIVHRRRLDPISAARIGRDVGNALAAAHQAHIIHRDLKPANIFLHHEPDMQPGEFILKVLDFGVSKPLGAQQENLTAVGMLIGSPGYMSPEQLASPESIDLRADIWSFGVMMFHMLCGELPFMGSLQEATQKILRGPIPRVSERRPDIPEELDALVSHCLVRDRALRIQSAAELSQRLSAFLQRTEAQSAPSPPAVSDIEKTWVLPMKESAPSQVSLESSAPAPPSAAPPTPSTTLRSNELAPAAGRKTPALRWITLATALVLAGLLGTWFWINSSKKTDLAPRPAESTKVPPPPAASETVPAPSPSPERIADAPTASADISPPAAPSPSPATPPPSTASLPLPPKPADPAPPPLKPAPDKNQTGIIRDAPF